MVNVMKPNQTKSYIFNMYKRDLSLNNLQWLICHKTKPYQTKLYQTKPNHCSWFGFYEVKERKKRFRWELYFAMFSRNATHKI